MEIGGIKVARGERVTIDLPLPPLYTHDELHMSVSVVSGKRAGPTLFVCAAIHGDEINGVEIIRRLLARKLISSLKGTLIAVPVVNTYGIVNRVRYLPDGRDLNRSFPGSSNGSLASRLAKIFMDEVAQGCDAGIDLHTATRHRYNLPQIRIQSNDPAAEKLAAAFQAPVILESATRPGSLRAACADARIPLLVYEAGEALRYDEAAIRAGLHGVMGVMRELGMLTPSRRIRKRAPVTSVTAKSSCWLRANSSGLLLSKVKPGQSVEKGQVLGDIVDPVGTNKTTLLSPRDGVVIASNNLPLIYEGEATFHLAFFEELDQIEAELDTFNELFEEA